MPVTASSGLVVPRDPTTEDVAISSLPTSVMIGAQGARLFDDSDVSSVNSGTD